MDAPSDETAAHCETMSDEPDFYLSWRQQWELFTTQKHIYKDGVWIEIDNIADLTRKPKAILRFFQDWQKLDWHCWHDGIIGWFCAVEHDNLSIQYCLRGVGAAQWRRDDRFTYFYKHTLDAPDPMTFTEFNRRVKDYKMQTMEDTHVEPTV